MREFKITPDSKGEDMASFALMLHNIIKLPITMRSLNEKGVRIDDGKIIEYDYTGPILEQVLKENKIIRTIPKTGIFKGRSVIVAPIRDEKENVIAALGVSDTYGALDFIECFCIHSTVIEEVEKCLYKKRDKKHE